MTEKAIEAALNSLRAADFADINRVSGPAQEAAMQSAIAAYEAALWQTIDTAPKTQWSPLLLEDETGQTVGWWEPNGFDIDGTNEPGWTDGSVDDWGTKRIIRLSPTNWRHLPDKPKDPGQ